MRATSWLQSRDEFSLDFSSKEATIVLDRGHDQAAIGPRSRGDRALIVDFSPAIFSWNRALCFGRVVALIPR